MISERLRDELISGPKQQSSMLTWPIFEGGLRSLRIENMLSKDSFGWTFKKTENSAVSDLSADSLLKSLPESTQAEIKSIFVQNHKIFEIVKRMRKQQSYSERYNSERLRPNFKPVDKKYWENIEALLLYSMIYHTHEQKNFIEIVTSSSESIQIEHNFINEQLKTYGKKINEILI